MSSASFRKLASKVAAEYRRKGYSPKRDPKDPRLTHGADTSPVPMAEVYLVLSDEERAKGFVRPVRRSYRHRHEYTGCGAVTTMGVALAETYACNPSFYGATYCVGCQMHRRVGEHGEFTWMAADGSDTTDLVGI